MYGTLTFTSTLLPELLMDAQILLHYLFVPNMVGMLPLFANFCSSVGSTYTLQWKVNIIYVLNTAGRLPLLYSK